MSLPAAFTVRPTLRDPRPNGPRARALTVAACALCLAGTLEVPIVAARIAFALPLALYLPGYAAVLASFPPHRALNGPRRFTLSVGLSLSILALGGLALNYVPGGLQRSSWSVLLAAVVLIGTLAGAIRDPGTGTAVSRPRLRPSRGTVLGASVGILAAAAAFVVAERPLPAHHASGFTQLWWRAGSDAARPAVTIGLTSDQQHRTTYSLDARLGNRRTTREITLRPGQTMLVRVPGPRSPHQGRVRVVISLFRNAAPDSVYRRVDGWLSIPTTDRR